jgi:large conductance mechanosensitive channel
MLADFKSFLTKSNALALAIGVIIGAAIGKVVSALSDDILMPIISLMLPGGDWREAKIVISTAVKDGKVTENAILYGHFLGTALDFIIVAFIVYLIAKAFLKELPSGK